MTSEQPTISAADLVAPPTGHKQGIGRLFQALRALDKECRLRRANKNERVVALISACIDAEIQGGKQIVGVLRTLGFDPQHVGMTLKRETGSDPDRYEWHYEGGEYHNHRPA